MSLVRGVTLLHQPKEVVEGPSRRMRRVWWCDALLLFASQVLGFTGGGQAGHCRGVRNYHPAPSNDRPEEKRHRPWRAVLE